MCIAGDDVCLVFLLDKNGSFELDKKLCGSTHMGGFDSKRIDVRGSLCSIPIRHLNDSDLKFRFVCHCRASMRAGADVGDSLTILDCINMAAQYRNAIAI